ncbi:MAG TPA: hypothetical protein VE912_14785 [Bacteroidales bacterium]|nr:hypothetical protein [Bacteroidales bacterium]
MNEDVKKSLTRLTTWLEKNGWAGYDPYDIKGHKWIIPVIKKGNKSYPFAIIREILFEFFYSFPVVSRKILGIKPQINAKAMGLFAKAYLDLYISTKKAEFLTKSEECLSWLDNNNMSEKGMGWGYPFDWQSQKLIPRFTPNGIVTTAAADAYWGWYEFTGDPQYLKSCERICVFLESLPVDHITEDQLCFSYTPLFQNHVHNLNLFVAEFLIKVGLKVENKHWVDLGLKATNYTLACQLNDGSFDYNGPPEKPAQFIDNYHTGFVLRMLHSIWKLTGKEKVYEALHKCYDHYINHFFEDKRIPWLMPARKYRLDIHSCAESINCLSELSVTFPEGIDLAGNILTWTTANLQDKKGYFYYGINKSRFFKFTYVSKIPYIRWSQAWMLKGISNYISNAE